MKNQFKFLAIALTTSALISCSGTKDATVSASGNTSLSDQSAVPENPNTPDSPTAMASNNVQQSLDTTISQFPVNSKGELSTDAFLHLATLAGTKSVELGKVAQQKGQNSEVRTLAKTLIESHTKADAELKTIASGLNLKINMDLDTLKPEQDYIAASKQLASLNFDKFDRAYLVTILKDHQSAVALFELGAASNEAAVKTFAQKQLPVLRNQLAAVEKLTK